MNNERGENTRVKKRQKECQLCMSCSAEDLLQRQLRLTDSGLYKLYV